MSVKSCIKNYSIKTDRQILYQKLAPKNSCKNNVIDPEWFISDADPATNTVSSTIFLHLFGKLNF